MDRQAGRQTDRQMDRQTDRQTDGQSDYPITLLCMVNYVYILLALLPIMTHTYFPYLPTVQGCPGLPFQDFIQVSRKLLHFSRDFYPINDQCPTLMIFIANSRFRLCNIGAIPHTSQKKTTLWSKIADKNKRVVETATSYNKLKQKY